VAAEADGRVRLAHAENNDEGTLKSFADSQIALDTQVVTDGLASYNSESLGQRPHQAVIQTKQERRESDALQRCHWTVSLLKRWLLGTHAGAVKPKRPVELSGANGIGMRSKCARAAGIHDPACPDSQPS